MNIVNTLFKEEVRLEIEKVLLKHLNSKQFDSVCNFLNQNLQRKNSVGNSFFISKSTIRNNILIFEVQNKIQIQQYNYTYIKNNGDSNNFLITDEIHSNTSKLENKWMEKEFLNIFLISSISIINFELNEDDVWVTEIFGKLKNDYLGINEHELEKLYDKILFSFNPLQVDIFSNWFNNLRHELKKKQVIPVLGGKFNLTRPLYSNGGGSNHIHSFELRKDVFDNLLFYFNNFIVESGENIKEECNLIIISKIDGEKEYVKLYNNKDETNLYNEKYQDSLLLFSYTKN
jgi:hypothetical protein